MPIKVGDFIPSTPLIEIDPQQDINLARESMNKKIIIFGVPGAFCPNCSQIHLPGYLEKASTFKRDGIDEIFCIAVNDPFVMQAWARIFGTQGKIRMLSDPNGNFTKALDLGTQVNILGGFRSKRYSMVVDDSVIETLNVEPDDVGLGCSLAQNLRIN